jgi:hypothetical protein
MADLWERQPIAKSAISVVVTGEGEALRTTLAGIAVAAKGHTYEVIVPSVPSRQAEVERLLQGASGGRVVLDEASGRGSGAALRSGIAAAKYPLVFTVPGGYDAGVLPAFLKEIDLVDIVCGTRRTKTKRWKVRQFFSVTYQIFGLWLQDPECPVRLYRREIFERIPIQSDGAFVQIEILAKANFESKLLTEVPIDGPVVDEPRESRDVWRVMKDPDFGPPPEKVDVAVKPIFAKQDSGGEPGA